MACMVGDSVNATVSTGPLAFDEDSRATEESLSQRGGAITVSLLRGWRWKDKTTGT